MDCEINNEKLEKYDKTKDCNICGSLLYDAEFELPILTLKCGHQYHKECIEEAFEYLQVQRKTNNKICPYCSNVHEYGKARYVSTPYKKFIPYYGYSKKSLCNAIFKTGKKAGTKCCAKPYEQYNGYCKRHRNYKSKTKKIQDKIKSYNKIYEKYENTLEKEPLGIGKLIDTIITLSKKYEIANEELLKVEKSIEKIEEIKYEQDNNLNNIESSLENEVIDEDSNITILI